MHTGARSGSGGKHAREPEEPRGRERMQTSAASSGRGQGGLGWGGYRQGAVRRPGDVLAWSSANIEGMDSNRPWTSSPAPPARYSSDTSDALRGAPAVRGEERGQRGKGSCGQRGTRGIKEGPLLPARNPTPKRYHAQHKQTMRAACELVRRAHGRGGQQHGRDSSRGRYEQADVFMQCAPDVESPVVFFYPVLP